MYVLVKHKTISIIVFIQTICLPPLKYLIRVVFRASVYGPSLPDSLYGDRCWLPSSGSRCSWVSNRPCSSCVCHCSSSLSLKEFREGASMTYSGRAFQIFVVLTLKVGYELSFFLLGTLHLAYKDVLSNWFWRLQTGSIFNQYQSGQTNKLYCRSHKWLCYLGLSVIYVCISEPQRTSKQDVLLKQ